MNGERIIYSIKIAIWSGNYRIKVRFVVVDKETDRNKARANR